MESKALAHRSHPHIARRLWHFGGVMGIFLLDWFFPAAILKIALYVTAALVTLDLLRLRYSYLNKKLIWLFRPFLREHERDQIAGSTYMLLGITLIVYFLPRPVVLLTLLFFAVADPVAGYIGTRFGRDRLIGPKTLQGSTAAFIACFLLTLIYCISQKLMLDRLIIVAVLSALIGAISEIFPIANLDDNFTFPVLSALSLTLVFHLFGGL
jgi:diacylglycerol kinase (CTP)